MMTTEEVSNNAFIEVEKRLLTPMKWIQELKKVISALAELPSHQTLEASDVSSMDVLIEFGPLLCALKRINREVYTDVLEQKQRVGEARSKVDSARLALQNLKYEESMLEQEVRSCQEFQSIFQDIPLQSVEEFEAARSEKGLEMETDPHALMLARLQFELEERKRLQDDKQRLQHDKGEVVNDNKLKKAKLEQVERSLKELSAAAQLVQTRLESF